MNVVVRAGIVGVAIMIMFSRRESGGGRSFRTHI